MVRALGGCHRAGASFTNNLMLVHLYVLVKALVVHYNKDVVYAECKELLWKPWFT